MATPLFPSPFVPKPDLSLELLELKKKFLGYSFTRADLGSQQNLAETIKSSHILHIPTHAQPSPLSMVPEWYIC